MATKRGVEAPDHASETYSWGERFASLKSVWHVVLLIVWVLGSIYMVG